MKKNHTTPTQHIIDLGLLATQNKKTVNLNRLINFFSLSGLTVSALLLWESPNNLKQQSLSLACTILALTCFVFKPKPQVELEAVTYHRR